MGVSGCLPDGGRIAGNRTTIPIQHGLGGSLSNLGVDLQVGIGPPPCVQKIPSTRPSTRPQIGNPGWIFDQALKKAFEFPWTFRLEE